MAVIWAAVISGAISYGSAYIASQAAKKGQRTDFDVKPTYEMLPPELQKQMLARMSEGMSMPGINKLRAGGQQYYARGPGFRAAQDVANMVSPYTVSQTTRDPGKVIEPYAAATSGIAAAMPDIIKAINQPQQQPNVPGMIPYAPTPPRQSFNSPIYQGYSGGGINRPPNTTYPPYELN